MYGIIVKLEPPIITKVIEINNKLDISLVLYKIPVIKPKITNMNVQIGKVMNVPPIKELNDNSIANVIAMLKFSLLKENSFFMV